MTQTVELLAGQRQKSESYKAIQACNDYLRMGPTRSLGKLSGVEWRQMASETWPIRTLQRWSARYDWQRRAEEYDAQMDAAKTARAQEIMRSGLALAFERVHDLRQLTVFWQIQ